MHLLNGRPKSGEGVAEYGSRIVTLIMSRWKTRDLKQIAVSAALAHMAQIENNLLRWVFTINVETLNELQQQLQAHTFTKRNTDEDVYSTGPERKKSKFLSQVKWHNCGKDGHK